MTEREREKERVKMSYYNINNKITMIDIQQDQKTITSWN